MVSASTLPASALAKTSQRKRKAHNKSRAGCGNCKIRRVKVCTERRPGFYRLSRNTSTLTCVRLQCDELKPKCKKCMAFGVSCNYGAAGSTSVGELVLSFEGASCMEAPSKAPISMNQTMLDLINYNMRNSPTGKLLGDQIYKLTAQDLAVLDRFSNRTILTIGTDVTKWILQAETPRLACLVSCNDFHMIEMTLLYPILDQVPYRCFEDSAPFPYTPSFLYLMVYFMLWISDSILTSLPLILVVYPNMSSLFPKLTKGSTRFSCMPCWPSPIPMIASSSRHQERLMQLSSSITTKELPFSTTDLTEMSLRQSVTQS